MKKRLLSVKYLLVMTWLLLAGLGVQAQEKENAATLNVSADIMSRYIWRGLNLGGTSPSIQPCLEFGKGNLAIGAWGAYSFNQAIQSQEMDLYASYTFADLINLTVTDYFLPSEIDSIKNKYFNYKEDETGHLFEVSAKFLGTEKIPLSLMVAANVFGADARKANGDKQFSTYIELGYDFEVKGTECSAFLGFTPTSVDTDKGESGYYGDGPGVINLGVTANREIKVTDQFSLPVSTSLITNPQAENIYLVFGISF